METTAPQLREFRCTRSALYKHNCPGRDDIRARQGHYVEAIDEADARRQMCEDFPNDNGDFTVTDVTDL